jgi:hypothetical protein
MSSKPRILLYWGYQRKAWVEPFERIRDQFELSFLYYINKEDETEIHSDLPKHYWSDYPNAQTLLSELKPDKILFMGITGSHCIALNYVARKRGIFTAVVQHGLFHSFEKYLKLQDAQSQRRADLGKADPISGGENRSFLINFYLRSVGYANLSMIWLLFRLQREKSKVDEYRAFSRHQSEKRLADEYWVFTKSNADLYKKRDAVTESRMREFGNPEMDSFVKQAERSKKEDYYLLVDQSFAEIKEWDSPGYGPTKEKVLSFYIRLQKYCESKSAKLVVKLHPYSYSSDFFDDLHGIKFLKDHDVVPLIMEARAVFGFFSSLMLPAIYYKPCILFRMFDESDFINRVEELELARVIDYDDFDKASLEFDSHKSAESLATFEAEYLYRADGKSCDRLAQLMHKN